MAKAGRKSAPRKKTRTANNAQRKAEKKHDKKSPAGPRLKAKPGTKAPARKPPIRKRLAKPKALKRKAVRRRAKPAPVRAKTAPIRAKPKLNAGTKPTAKAAMKRAKTPRHGPAPKAPKKPSAKAAPSAPQGQLIVIEGENPPVVAAVSPIQPVRPRAVQPAPAMPAPRPAAPANPAAAEAPPSPEPPKAPPHIDASGQSDGPLAIPLTPALEMLPDWEDRLRLRRAIFEEGLTFYSLGRHCPEFHEASSMLAPSKKDAADSVPGYFMVCLKDRSGKMAGAMDGHMLGGGVMAIGRSAARGDRRRELHILLYSAALSGHQPSYVVFSTKKAPITEDSAAQFILLGRGFGFSGIPARLPDALLLLRRVKRELDPISSGQEISQALGAARPIFGSRFDAAIGEISKKGIMPLIPLPASPDSREHLHELRDTVPMLGLSADGLESVLERLLADYVLGRKDITPEIIS
ncbi:hypothetical protein L0Y65_05740 [Candidatus Micrarchaeota archaeon]|nr:hypothetical protein [Candidatus Micrarchaeota archaeon]